MPLQNSTTPYQVELSLGHDVWEDTDDYFRRRTLDDDLKLSRLIRITGYISKPHFVDSDWLEEELPNRARSTPPNSLWMILRKPDGGYWSRMVVPDVKGTSKQLIRDELDQALACFIAAEDGSDMGIWLVIVPTWDHFRRFGISEGGISRGLEAVPGIIFNVSDLRSDDHAFLHRNDDDFTARKVERTVNRVVDLRVQVHHSREKMVCNKGSK